MAFLPGEMHPNHKLTEQDVVQIRLLHQNKQLNQVELSEKFGVSRRQIYRIINWQDWITVWDERLE